MAVNPAGYVPVTDFEAPHILGGRARDAIVAGDFVALSGPAASSISSGINSFDPSVDFLFHSTSSGLDFVGIALAAAGSNESVSVITNGCHIVTAAGTLLASRTVVNNGANAVKHATTAGHVIGRALVSAGSEEYTILQLGRS